MDGQGSTVQVKFWFYLNWHKLVNLLLGYHEERKQCGDKCPDVII